MTTAILPILSALPAHYGHGPGWFILIPMFWILLIGLSVLAARRRPEPNRCCANATPAARSTKPSTANAWKSCAPS